MPSSESEDDLVSYGTPLEPLEEDEIPTKKSRLLEDQVVTDKQGRRRFHGAFTGGFSAGFFNTVGSLEGWTPSSFKSSKSNKQEFFQQKPEDFMDEEDLSEFGIAPVVLKAKQDYISENKKEGSKFLKFPTIGTYVLQDLLKPARETVGIKLLKKMGWKPGQGVGPRLSKKEKEKTLKIRQKTYGCQLPFEITEEKESNQNSDSEWDDIEFAPNDYEPFHCEERNNFFGLGYEGLDKRPVLSGNSLKKDDSIKEKSKKFGLGSQAFGVGAFEEEDEDIYARDDMSRYDFSLGNDLSMNKLIDENSKVQDGALEGFVLETKKRIRKDYPLPILPKDFKPQHKIRRSRFDQPLPDDKAKNKKELKISSEDRKKLVEESSAEELEANRQKEKLAKEIISNVKINESRFKPFCSYPDKQERYENYLKLVKIGQKERLSDLQPLSMTSWDREREKVEFEKAAALFRPLSGGMEERFLTASQPDDLSDPLAVVEKYIDENDDRRKAAKMNMFGTLTRRTEDWVPSSLLCKRFNIPEPKKEHFQNIEKKTGKSYYNLFDDVQDLKERVKKTENLEKNEEYSTHGEAKEIDSNKIGGDNQNLNDTLDKTDLFKAIFLESDEEEEKSDEKAIEPEKLKEDQCPNTLGAKDQLEDDLLYEEKLINSKRNLSPPSGIFKNIDLKLLSGVKRTTEEIEKSKTIKSVVETVGADSVSSYLVYGPKIPEKISPKAGLVTNRHFEDDGVWVEKKTHSGKKHKKKEKKHRKAVHKSKHKHKKHKR